MGESVSLLTYSGQYLFQITLYWIFLSKMRKQTLCSQRFLNSLQGFLIRNPRGEKNFWLWVSDFLLFLSIYTYFFWLINASVLHSFIPFCDHKLLPSVGRKEIFQTVSCTLKFWVVIGLRSEQKWLLLYWVCLCGSNSLDGTNEFVAPNRSA